MNVVWIFILKSEEKKRTAHCEEACLDATVREWTVQLGLFDGQWDHVAN